jgi:hypothetical protein
MVRCTLDGASRRRRLLYRMVVLALTMLPAPMAGAQDVVKPLKSGRLAVSFAYHFELLDAALQRSIPRYGAYVERPFTEPMSPLRDQKEGVTGELINILIAEPGIPALDGGMIRVPIALDRGLHGTRIAFITKGSQGRFDNIKTVDDLRRFTVGQGVGWGDVKVYEHNRIQVETAPNYESLLNMLQFGRFDLFPRGAAEVAGEFAAYREQHPGLAIEQNLVIKYRFPQFFYVSRNAARVAERIVHGLMEMQHDGEFDAIFHKHFGRIIDDLKINQRVVIELDNPFLPPETRVTP